MAITFTSAAPFLLAMATPVAIHDVPVYSSDSADALLNAPAVDATADAATRSGQACPQGSLKMPDGSCSQTRRFSLPNRGDQPADDGPGFTLSRGRAMAGQPSRPAVQPRPARGNEVPLRFGVGSSRLSPQSMTNLRTLATALNTPAHSGKRIQIVGHTDRTGKQEANVRLSQRRAETAADYLAGQGVTRSRIEAVGKGYDAPLAGISAYSPRQRRVEVIRVK